MASEQHPPHHHHSEPEFGPVSLVVLILSVYVLVALVVDTFFSLPVEVARVLEYIDSAICVFFLGEFFWRFFKAKNKVKFMRWGWIDLLSSIPTLSYLRPGQGFRILRLLRLLRVFRSFRHLWIFLHANRIQGAFTTATLIAVAMVIFSAIAILEVETAPNSNIKTAEDAIWWSYVTITSVGYGDRYPVTTEGRIIAGVLMTVGMGLFGTFTGYLASWFVAERKETDEESGTSESKGK
jgi:voltage-gated potassium channel